MTSGYVYILINHSLPGLLKVGRTARDSRERARELSTTSIPTPYIVAYETFTEDSEGLEKKMHSRLADSRVSDNREFFRYPLDKAIQVLIEYVSPPSHKNAEYSAVDIHDKLIEKYGNDMDPTISAVRIVQTSERVWLEVTREDEVAGYLKDQYIKRTDLAFVVGKKIDRSLFPTTVLVSENARCFLDELDPFSIIMTTDLFHSDACHRIDLEMNPYYKNTEGKT